jgi:hypothetical protein
MKWICFLFFGIYLTLEYCSEFVDTGVPMCASAINSGNIFYGSVRNYSVFTRKCTYCTASIVAMYSIAIVNNYYYYCYYYYYKSSEDETLDLFTL